MANRAVKWYLNQSLQSSNRFWPAYAFYVANQWDEANVLFEELAQEEPDNVNYKGYLGTIAARMGDRDKAFRISAELVPIKRDYYRGWHFTWRARIAALLGEKQKAVDLLKEAFAQGRYYGLWLHMDMDFEPLWDYTPFKELLKPKG